MKILLSIICILGIIEYTVSAGVAPRIVGGSDAGPTDFPHQIALLGNYAEQGLVCSGSIIADTWCITAAHCIVGNSDPDYYTVGAGSVVFNTLIKFAVERVIPHENFDFNNKDDIGLIQMKVPFTFSSTINKISVLRSTVPANKQIIISGWGLLSTNGQLPDHYQYNDKLKVGGKLYCDVFTRFRMYPGVYCFKHSPGDGACYGDSGGPAVYNGYLIGVTNYGTDLLNGCGTLFPDVYTNIDYYGNWVNTNAGSTII